MSFFWDILLRHFVSSENFRFSFFSSILLTFLIFLLFILCSNNEKQIHIDSLVCIFLCFPFIQKDRRKFSNVFIATVTLLLFFIEIFPFLELLENEESKSKWKDARIHKKYYEYLHRIWWSGGETLEKNINKFHPHS